MLGIDPVNQINKKSTILSSTYLMRDGIEQTQESINVFQETFKIDYLEAIHIISSKVVYCKPSKEFYTIVSI